MKKINHILSWLLVVTILTGLLSTGAAAAIEIPGENLPEGFEQIDRPAACRPGTTPPRGGAQLLSEDNVITPEAVANSLERYQNFLAADLELFYWSEEGINIQNDGRLSTPEELEYVRQRGLEITAGCETADEKIYAVAKYLAQNICYDYDAYEGRKPEEEHTPSNAYDVLTREYCTCGGYAVTFAVMMQQLGIPCVVVISPDHAWNMVYNGERWMLLDVTWISGSVMRDGVKYKSDDLWMEWYDFTIEQANSDYNHTILSIPYSVCNGTLERFPKETSVTEFTVPSSVTAIGEWSFHECSLKKVTLSYSVERIDQYAFAACTSLTDITIPGSVKTIGERAFWNCPSIKNVALDDGVESIGPAAFADCPNITSFTMSNTVTTIGDGALWGCKSLTRFTIPDSVTSIGEAVLYDCTRLTHLSIGDGITSLDNFYLSNHPNLVSVELGSGITSLGDWAFHNCAKLTTVKLSRGLESIGAYTFADCKALTSITIPSSVKTIGERAFMECSSLAGVTLYNGLESIGFGAFANCVNLTEITIPGTVTTIGEWAICYCTKLTTVTLMEGIKTIGECAFYESNAIQTVNFTGSQNQWRSITIAGYNDNLLNARINYNVQPPDLDEPEPEAPVEPETPTEPEVPDIPGVWDENSKMGDANGDRKVTTRDAIVMLQAIASKTLDTFNATQFTVSDVSRDGKITTRDAIIILQAIASKTTDKL